ncbi:hypothetical protein BB561_000778 [Smittium simulii]|uniref:Amino acid transporter transmembrane domain-containing protein n=1 Tax=Smittium simulii TaxID=133385 RepID=A0A2T9YXL5_9FUNG|nr:hypothetical protein BB561_000778 [Smittium simulii]
MQNYNKFDQQTHELDTQGANFIPYSNKSNYMALEGKATVTSMAPLENEYNPKNSTHPSNSVSQIGYNSDLKSRYKEIMDLGIEDSAKLNINATEFESNSKKSKNNIDFNNLGNFGENPFLPEYKSNHSNGLSEYENRGRSNSNRLNSVGNQNSQYLSERSDSMIRLQKSKRLSKLKELDSEGRAVKDRLKTPIHISTNTAERPSEDSETYSINDNVLLDNVISRENTSTKSITTISSLFIFICVTVNIGSLQLPYAFSRGGWATIGFIFISLAASVISGIMTFQCLQFTQGSYKRNFHHVTKFAFGSKGYAVSLGLTNINTISSCVVLLNIIGSMSGSIFDTTKRNFDDRVWMTIFSVLILAQFLLIRKFSGFARFGVFGGILAIVMLIIFATMGYSIKGTFDLSASIEGYDNVNRLKMVDNTYVPSYSTSALGFPIALAFSGYAFGGQPIHTIIQENTATLKNWPVSIVLGSLVSGILFAVFGSSIYYSLGDIGSIGAIPFQLPLNALSTTTYALILAHSLIIVPIYFYTISYDWESSLNLNRYNMYKSSVVLNTTRVILRASLWVFALILAAFVPRSYSVFNTLAIFTSGVVYYILPGLSYLKINGWRSCSLFEKFGTILVITVGSIVSIFGSYGAFYYLLYGTQVRR